ncbi:MAG: M50 family metallopeptidase [Anaerolineae bacterium]
MRNPTIDPTMSTPLSPERRRQELLLAGGAFLLVFILWQTNAVTMLLYPFRLLVTFVHETGHGLAALISGGQFLQFRVDPNGAGIASTAGGNPLLVLPMGYIGAALFGAVLLYVTNRMSNTRRVTTTIGIYFILSALLFTGDGRYWLLFGVAAALGLWMLAERWQERRLGLRFLSAIVALLTLFVIRDNVALIVGLISGAVILALGALAPRSVTVFVLNALSFIVGFNAINDVSSLWNNPGGSLGMVRNDAYAMAEYTHLPVHLWIILWTLTALALMGVSIYLSFRRRRTESQISTS